MNIILDDEYKNELLSHFSNAIKQVQIEQIAKQSDESPENKFTVTADSPSGQILCTSLEMIFMHGLKKRQMGYWEAVRYFCRGEVVRTIRQLAQVKTDVGRGRAWIFIALNENELEGYLQSFLIDLPHMYKYYQRYAMLCSSQVSVMQTLISGLEYIDFKLRPDVPYLDFRISARQSSTSTNSLALSSSTHIVDKNRGSVVHIDATPLTELASKSKERAASFIKEHIQRKNSTESTGTNLPLRVIDDHSARKDDYLDFVNGCRKCAARNALICLCADENIENTSSSENADIKRLSVNGNIPHIGPHSVDAQFVPWEQPQDDYKMAVTSPIQGRFNPFDKDSKSCGGYEPYSIKPPALKRFDQHVAITNTPIEVIRKTKKIGKKRKPSDSGSDASGKSEDRSVKRDAVNHPLYNVGDLEKSKTFAHETTYSHLVESQHKNRTCHDVSNMQTTNICTTISQRNRGSFTTVTEAAEHGREGSKLFFESEQNADIILPCDQAEDLKPAEKCNIPQVQTQSYNQYPSIVDKIPCNITECKTFFGDNGGDSLHVPMKGSKTSFNEHDSSPHVHELVLNIANNHIQDRALPSETCESPAFVSKVDASLTEPQPATGTPLCKDITNRDEGHHAPDDESKSKACDLPEEASGDNNQDEGIVEPNMLSSLQTQQTPQYSNGATYAVESPEDKPVNLTGIEDSTAESGTQPIPLAKTEVLMESSPLYPTTRSHEEGYGTEEDDCSSSTEEKMDALTSNGIPDQPSTTSTEVAVDSPYSLEKLQITERKYVTDDDDRSKIEDAFQDSGVQTEAKVVKNETLSPIFFNEPPSIFYPNPDGVSKNEVPLKDDNDKKDTDFPHGCEDISHPSVVDIDNNLRLYLLIEILKDESEAIIKMFHLSTGHTEGNWVPLYLLFSDCYIYFMRSGDGKCPFQLEHVVSYEDVDYVSTGYGSQAMQFVFYKEKAVPAKVESATKRRMRRKITIDTADERLTDVVILAMSEAFAVFARQRGVVKACPPIFHDSKDHEVCLRKYVESEGCLRRIDLYNLVHWEDPGSIPGEGALETMVEGVLEYKTHSFWGSFWKSAYFVLTNGMLCQYKSKESPRPDVSYDLRENSCVGCKRIRSNSSKPAMEFEVIFQNDKLEMRASSDVEVTNWLQCLCLSVSLKQSSKKTKSKIRQAFDGISRDALVPCSLVVTSENILLFHEDHHTGFCRTLAKTRNHDIASINFDQARNVCEIVTATSEKWAVFFSNADSVKKFDSVIGKFSGVQAIGTVTDERLQAHFKEGRALLDNRWTRPDNLLTGRLDKDYVFD